MSVMVRITNKQVKDGFWGTMGWCMLMLLFIFWPLVFCFMLIRSIVLSIVEWRKS